MYDINVVNRIIESMARTYREVFGERLVDLRLYGSYARGDFGVDSDIDLAAIVKGERVELQQALRQVWDVSSELSLEYDVIISPTVIPYDEFQKFRTVLPYYRNIDQEGVKVYG